MSDPQARVIALDEPVERLFLETPRWFDGWDLLHNHWKAWTTGLVDKEDWHGGCFRSYNLFVCFERGWDWRRSLLILESIPALSNVNRSCPWSIFNWIDRINVSNVRSRKPLVDWDSFLCSDLPLPFLFSKFIMWQHCAYGKVRFRGRLCFAVPGSDTLKINKINMPEPWLENVPTSGQK